MSNTGRRFRITGDNVGTASAPVGTEGVITNDDGSDLPYVTFEKEFGTGVEWYENFEFLAELGDAPLKEEGKPDPEFPEAYSADDEVDPSGKSPHESGSKLDSGKLLANQILRSFARALTAVVEVGTFGANKYTLDGWEEVEDARERYQNAEVRHQLKRWAGEDIDPDSQLLHEAHELWNKLAALELLLRESSNGD